MKNNKFKVPLILVLLLAFAVAMPAYAKAISKKVKLEAEIRVAREYIAKMMDKDPGEAVKKSLSLLNELNKPKYLLRFSKKERNAFRDAILRNELYPSSLKSGNYIGAAEAIRRASTISSNPDDKGCINYCLRSQKQQNEIYNKSLGAMKNAEKIIKKKRDLAKEKEKLIRSYKRNIKVSKSDIETLNARMKSIDALIAYQDNLLSKEIAQTKELQTELQTKGLTYNSKQEKKLNSQEKDIVKATKKLDKQIKEDKKILGKVVGTYYYGAQMRSMDKIENLYKSQANLEQQKLALIKRANNEKNPTKELLEVLKHELSKIDEEISRIKAELEEENANLKKLVVECDQNNGSFTIVQATALKLNKNKLPKMADAVARLNVNVAKQLSKVIEVYEVSWEDAEETAEALNTNQNSLLKFKEMLQKFAGKKLLSKDDIQKVKDILAKIKDLRATKGGLLQRFEKAFINSRVFKNITAALKGKFASLFGKIWKTHNAIVNQSPLKKLIDTVIKIIGSSTGNNNSEFDQASGIFGSKITRQVITFTDGQLTITNCYDENSMFLGSKIQSGNTVIWKNAAGDIVKKEYVSSESAEQDDTDDTENAEDSNDSEPSEVFIDTQDEDYDYDTSQDPAQDNSDSSDTEDDEIILDENGRPYVPGRRNVVDEDKILDKPEKPTDFMDTL